MFVVFKFFFAFFFLFFGFHTFYDFFLFDIICKDIHHINDDHIRVCGLGEDIIYPTVRLAADVDKNIRCGNLGNVFYGRFITMEVYAIINQ